MAFKKQNYIEGAAVLAATVIITKLIGAVYKIPLYNLLGDRGTTHFQMTYYIYSVLLSVSTAGLPVALSRLISAARAQDRPYQVRRYFRVGLALFAVIGLMGTALMALMPNQLAALAGDDQIGPGLVALAPAVLFVCIISAYRGHSQGFSDMLPTAVSQILEVLCKLIFGLAIAWLLLRQGADEAAVSAGAIVGVTIGLGLAVPVLMLYKRRIDKSEPLPEKGDTPDSVKATLWEILKVGVPITVSSAALSVINLLDAKLALLRLEDGAGFTVELAQTLYGAYSKAITLFNLPSAIIVPLTVSVVPAISAALAKQRGREARGIMESSLKLTNLIALPCAAGLAVLAGPIFSVLYPGSHESGPALLFTLGIGTYFCCAYLITTAILQAAGYEKFSLFALPVGGIVKIAVNWVLIGRPEINIYGAPIGTLACYLAITVFNIVFIGVKIKDKPDFIKTLLRPLACTGLMAAAAWSVHGLADKFLSPMLGGGRLAEVGCLGLGVMAGVVVYAVTIIALGALNSDDMALLPKGDKIAAKLHIRPAAK